MRICKENVGGFRYEPRGDWFSFAKVRKRSFFCSCISQRRTHNIYVIHRNDFCVPQSAEVRIYLITFEIWIFILQNPMDSLQEAFIHPPELCETRFIMDARTLFHVFFWTVDNKLPLTPLKVLAGTGQCFNITLIGFVWKKKVTLRMLRGWVKHRLIFKSFLPRKTFQ